MKWCLFSVLLCASSAWAQSPADSFALLLPVARRLAADIAVRRYVIQAGRSPFLDSLARRLGARARGDSTISPPPCPWYRSTQGERGYRLSSLSLAVSGETAVVRLNFDCDNPPGYAHGVFAKGMQYGLQRTEHGWILLREDLTWIT